MKSGRIILFGGALAGIALGVNAQPVPQAAASTGFDERLRKLEEEVQSLRKENQELKSMLGDGRGGLITVKPAGKEVTLKLGGLLQAQADFLDKGDSRWGQRFRPVLSAPRPLERQRHVPGGFRFQD
jgi:hypothetical protein